MAILQIVNTAAFVLAVAVTGGAFAPAPAERAPTAAELAFSDAPYGVDPIVTGPVSGKFRAERDRAGCEDAVWPDIPVSCYPR
ncbi:hypothetical protein [Oricola thermophila]|uniref:Uncharacterized protein n=1 Tax=Oricola thermophila TaxID=2742145 RepID=A0A6N1VG90_9HYPH|nr:hypothetical protein [Oricola thermophila]QKV19936.1 hypothetical protein HTY61_16500 [Oricola thermophila]